MQCFFSGRISEAVCIPDSPGGVVTREDFLIAREDMLAAKSDEGGNFYRRTQEDFWR